MFHPGLKVKLDNDRSLHTALFLLVILLLVHMDPVNTTFSNNEENAAKRSDLRVLLGL